MRTPNLIVVAVLALAAPVSVTSSYAATEPPLTCQGQTATVVGPTEADGMSTVGTEGDDVIVAPLGTSGSVQGLGGNDRICLVDRVNAPVHDVTGVLVLAGPGDDEVYNEATQPVGQPINLGAGADTFVGADSLEEVYADDPAAAVGNAAEVDRIDTRGGDDRIRPGCPAYPTTT